MTTPMMQQWAECKAQAAGALLLFRMGDFYEAFHDDAELAARELDLTLTKRQEIPMAGVPVHAVDSYLDRLIAKGHRVAIAEQIEDPKLAKGLVKREVVRIITPGTVIDSSLVSEKANNFFACAVKLGSTIGLAALDLTTSEFLVTEVANEQQLVDELARLKPAEILVSDRFLVEEVNAPHIVKPHWFFDGKAAHDTLTTHLNVTTLDGFGLAGMNGAIQAAGATLHYLMSELCLDVSHIQQLTPYATTDYLALDAHTQANLDLPALLRIIDQTKTPMGGRMLAYWVSHPLLSPVKIIERQNAVATFLKTSEITSDLTLSLTQVRDLERLIMKVSSGCATPRDLISLSTSLGQVPGIARALRILGFSLEFTDHSPLVADIANTLVDEPPAKQADGGFIRPGFSHELDELRSLITDNKAWLASYQTQIRSETDIKTLRVGYNRVFGYYIEVSRGQADRMPDTFQRRQTLTNAERFISPELKEYESKVLTAESRMAHIEARLFADLRLSVAQQTQAVLRTARQIAEVDALNSLALTARARNYCRPTVNDFDKLSIIEGRHPVIEATTTDRFIPNETLLGGPDQRLMLITGPNMAGKSTYIRQVALLTILAQVGSYIPATSAEIGIVDKIFTRIGASDDLARGQSTFMVEMTETANILNNATDRSLVILDEIGRGTSTYDGVSIAWSVAEYLLTTPNKRAKTLFATHYFELTQLEGKVDGAINYNVAVKEHDDQIVFLHKIVRGSADRSYGIHVARLAGLPMPAVLRAREILSKLEGKARKANRSTSLQMNLFE